MIIVSACLAGIKCRYNGEASPSEDVIKLIKSGRAIPLCPEQLGGLSTPRGAAEIKDGRVFTIDGEDLTEKFQFGANEVLEFANLINCKEAILKTNSPSCGRNLIYDGTFTGKLIKGDGILTKTLLNNNFIVHTELDFKFI